MKVCHPTFVICIVIPPMANLTDLCSLPALGIGSAGFLLASCVTRADTEAQGSGPPKLGEMLSISQRTSVNAEGAFRDKLAVLVMLAGWSPACTRRYFAVTVVSVSDT